MKKIIELTKHVHWSNSTRLKLESKLIYLNSPKLCLDPDPYIGILSRRILNNKLLFRNKLFQNLQRKRFKSIFPHKPVNIFKLLELINAKKPLLNRKIKVISNPENSFKINTYASVEKLAKAYPQPIAKVDQHEMIHTEEFLVEFLDQPDTSTKLTIIKRPFDDVYFGKITNILQKDVQILPKLVFLFLN